MERQTNYDEPINLPGNPTREDLLAMLDEAVRAVLARPESAMRHCNRAILLLGLGRPEEALGAADRAVRAESGRADAHVVRGIVLHSLGQMVEALRGYERAIGLDPSNTDARNNRGSALLAMRRYEEAVEELDRVIGAAPRYADAHVNRGRALHLLGRDAEAVRALRRAVAIRHNDAQVWFDIGALLFQMKNTAKSLGAIETAIKIQPGYAKAHHARGIILRHLGRDDEADAAFERAHGLDPELVAPSLPVEVDDIYVAWHEARDIRNRLDSPSSPQYVLRHQIRSRIAEFLNAARRVLDYHEKLHKSGIVREYHDRETRAKKYLQHVNTTKHERLLDVRITKTGERLRVYPNIYTGEPAFTVGENARLFRGGKHYDIDTWPDEMFGEGFGRGYLYEVQVCHVILEDGEVELVEFMDTILGGVKELLEKHGYDTSGLADSSPYYGLS